MLEFTSGDILKAQVDALVNTVNCVGVMGRGIALQFKKAYPGNFDAYAAACKAEEVIPGKMHVYQTGFLTSPKFIINFPTKRHWRGKSRIEDIEAGLRDLALQIKSLNIESIAIPPLGSGLGGLNWQDVKARIMDVLADIDNVHILVYEPKGAPAADEIVHNKKVPNMTPGRAALVKLVNEYLGALLDPFVTLLEVHKLMYFMQESGESLRLNFQPAQYGPYAENLRHVLNAIEGHMISGYGDGGDAPNKQLELVPGAVSDANAFLKQYSDTNARFKSVTELVSGFESSFGLELLSTVHWVLKNKKTKSLEDLVSKVHSWNPGKRRFTKRQIDIATQTLVSKGWIGKSLTTGQ